MKKMFFIAAVASVALASCSKDRVIDEPSYNEEEGQQAIEFKMTPNIEVVTRGTGAVGDLEGVDNVWKGQKLNVYMFDSGTMDLAVNSTDGKNYFENDTIVAPNGVTSGEATPKTGVKYYASNGTYDFYAYHGDDAVTTAPVYKSSAYTVNFTIDGTQDLMIAKAGLNAADEKTITDWETANGGKTFDRAKVYSAYSARRGVQPRFAFEHQLSRFVFNAIAMEEGVVGVNGLVIDSVKVLGAKTTGTMTVASLDATKLGVKFTSKPVDTLMLKDRAADTLKPVSLAGKQVGDTVRLGESLLLAPEVTKYATEIYYSQIKVNGEKKDTIKNVYAADIKLTGDAPFVKGTQYDVNIKVYDNKLIVLTAELKPWEDGEDVELDSEQ